MGEEEALTPEVRGLRADPRAVAIAYAMERRGDGSGDVCAPGPAAPGPTLAFGGTPLEFLRHATGRATGPNHGRGGGLNWTDWRHGLLGDGGPPGTMTQVLAGAAMAFRRLRQPRVALVFEHAVAADTGGWHEGLNLAAAQEAPLIVVMIAPDDGNAAVEAAPVHRGELSEAYGIRTLTFSDEPLSELLERVGEARSQALDGGGPVVIRLMPASSEERWAGLEALVQECREKELIPPASLDQVASRAARDVEHAVLRLGREPAPEALEALGPIRTDEPRIPPWTRQDPPSPGSRLPLEEKGPGVVL